MRLTFILVSAVGCLILAIIPPPDGVSASAFPALALILFTVSMWASTALPEYVAALIFFSVATISAIASPTAIFAGFQSSALWLVFGGLVIGAAADRSGLGLWVAHGAFRYVGSSYASLIFAILIGSLALSVIIPSSVGRIAIVLPPVMAIARQAGYPAGSSGFVGAVIATVFGNYVMGQGFLPANLVNILLVGTMGTMYGLEVSYGEYLILNLPILAVSRGLLVGVLVFWLFKPDGPGKPISSVKCEPLTDDGRKLLAIMTFALVIWATDFIHGIVAGWVALVAAVICMLPGINLVPSRLFVEKINMATILFVAALLGVGPVLVESGAGSLLRDIITDLAGWKGQTPAYGFYAMTLVSFITALVSNVSASLAVVTPTAVDLAEATGLALKTAALAQLNGLSSLVFPYQALPIMVGLAMGGVPMIKVLKFSVTLAAIGLVVLTPLNFYYWRALGYIPG